MNKNKIRKVMNFLRHYIRFDNSDMFTKFEQEISILTEGSTTMGIEEYYWNRLKRKVLKKVLKKELKKTSGKRL